jgi:myosin heavy subunit
VVEHARGERSYHVLYQLCAGASAKEKEALKLPDG